MGRAWDPVRVLENKVAQSPAQIVRWPTGPEPRAGGDGAVGAGAVARVGDSVLGLLLCPRAPTVARSRQAPPSQPKVLADFCEMMPVLPLNFTELWKSPSTDQWSHFGAGAVAMVTGPHLGGLLISGVVSRAALQQRPRHPTPCWPGRPARSHPPAALPSL